MKEDFKELYNPVGIPRSWKEWAEDTRILSLQGFLRDDILVRTEVSMIYGPSGSGKSYLALYIGCCVVTGLPVHGLRTTRGRVLFLSEEMPHQVIHERCLRMLNPESADQLGDNFNIVCQAGFDFHRQVAESQRRLQQLINSTQSHLVFIDAHQDTNSAPENDNQEQGAVFRAIRAVARVTGSCIVMIDHMGKPDEFGNTKGARGASSKRDVCEAQLEVTQLSKAGDIPRSLVKFVKTRHLVGKAPAPFEFIQEEDHNRRVNVAGDGEEPRMKSGIAFVTANHMGLRTEDANVRAVRDLLSVLANDFPDRQVPLAEVIKCVALNLKLTDHKAKETIKRARELRIIVGVSNGRKLCLPES